MIRIAFVIDRIESPTAGTEKHLVGLIEGLDRASFEPHLFVLQPTPWSEAYHGCPVSTVGLYSLRSPRSLLALRRFSGELRKRRVDIVHTHFTDAHVAGCLAGRWAGVGAIITAIRNQGYSSTRFQMVLRKLLDRFVTHYLVNSADTGEWLQAAQGVPPQRIYVIHNGVELSRHQAVTADERTSLLAGWGFPADAFVVGIVANLRPVKRLDVFLRAAALVARELDRARFVVVGEGPQRAELNRLALELGLGDRFRFVGQSREVHRLLPGLDVGLLTSDSESFSNTVVEYMASSLPVVATDVGGLSEAVREGVNGHLCPPGNFNVLAERLLALAEHPKRALEMGRAGRALAEERFSREAMLARYEALYRKAVANGGN